jgi:hypothetical protein
MKWIKKSKKKEQELCLKGLLQALGVSGYCGLVGVVIWNGNSWFGKMNQYWGPVFFLMLFVMSAIVSALIVFYQPYKMLIKKETHEALQLVVNTALWLLGLVILGLVLMILM